MAGGGGTATNVEGVADDADETPTTLVTNDAPIQPALAPQPGLGDEPRRQREAERRVADHVVRLLDDRRFVIPTAFGPRPAASLQRRVHRWDRWLWVKKQMVELDVPDFDLQGRLPRGEGFDAALSRQVLLAFSQPMAHVRFASLPPVRDLIGGKSVEPLTAEQVRRSVGELPPPRSGDLDAVEGNGGGFAAAGGPMTLILFAGGGFSDDARRVAREFVDGPPTILIEPNDAGGFDVTGPPGSEFLREILDPEDQAERLMRVYAELDRRDVDLLTGAVALEEVAAAAKLPMRVVEPAARLWARRRAERGGDAVRVKRVDGAWTIYRDSSLGGGPESAVSAVAFEDESRRVGLPVMDRLRRLFGRGVSPQRKIAELAERRAALSRQRDRLYDEMGRLEDREKSLREAFIADETPSARRRITGQLVQLQKDVERRRQTVTMLNQQGERGRHAPSQPGDRADGRGGGAADERGDRRRRGAGGGGFGGVAGEQRAGRRAVGPDDGRARQR